MSGTEKFPKGELISDFYKLWCLWSCSTCQAREAELNWISSHLGLKTDLPGASAIVLCHANNNIIIRQQQTNSCFVALIDWLTDWWIDWLMDWLMGWLILHQILFLMATLALIQACGPAQRWHSKSAPLRLHSWWHLLRIEPGTTGLKVSRSKQESHFVDLRVLIPCLYQTVHRLLQFLPLKKKIQIIYY